MLILFCCDPLNCWKVDPDYQREYNAAAETGQAWATGVAERFGYAVTFQSIGEEDAEVGAATQMGVFSRIQE
ncbi:MAG: hypothetical protein ACYC6A_08075 [Armatimonadota bacterium]